MPRCFVTGIEIGLDEAFALDVSEVHRAMRELRSQLDALEKLMVQLGVYDKVELKDRRTGKPFTRLDTRLVSATVAHALAEACPERPIFLPFAEWKELRTRRVTQTLREIRVEQKTQDSEDGENKQSEAVPPHSPPTES